MRENILMIDSHNLLFRKVFTAHNTKPFDEKYNYFKKCVMRELFFYITLVKPTKVIFAIDDISNWRKQFFSEYKHKRTAARKKSTVDFEKFFPISNAFYDDLKDIFTNIYFIKVSECEGDDIIAVLTKNVREKITLVSSDRDFDQLAKYPNFVRFNPIKKEYVDIINPIKELQMKIVRGDRNDCIPGVLKRIGKVGAFKAVQDLTKFITDNKVHDEYERNKKLIDFDHIPEKYKIGIMTTYNNYPIKSYDARKFFSFFVKHEIADLFSEMQDIIYLIKCLR